MAFEGETFELELIAKAFEAISKEISFEGLAKALLRVALEYSGAVRGAVLLSAEDGALAKADASFSREWTPVFASYPLVSEFRLPKELKERVLTYQQTVVRHDNRAGSALIDPVQCYSECEITILCLPLIYRKQTIGVLYLESKREQEAFPRKFVSVMSMLASQTAVSFASVQLFETLRETSMWMVRGQQIGRMGSYRWNTRTLLLRASCECYRIFDIDRDVNPVPFEVFRSRVHPVDLPILERAIEDALSTKSPFKHEYRVVHQGGTTLHVVAVGQFDFSPSGDLELEGIISDVTEQKVAEQALADAQTELARAARLASLGELAGSIIHEVCQPLTGIIASAEACLRWLGRDPTKLDETRKSIVRIIEQGCRATSIVTSLRSLVRDGQLQFAKVKIHEAIEEVLLLSKRELERADITLRTDLDRSAPDIEADRVQLQQVIANLVRNSIDAMTDIDGRARVLTVSSKVVGGHASVAVIDTGPGIDPPIRERLFDALYTTKGEGLGLGLSICQKIISAHRGRLWVETNRERGTTFGFAVPIRQSANVSKTN